jgi:hypothetical protein
VGEGRGRGGRGEREREEGRHPKQLDEIDIDWFCGFVGG